MRVQDVMTKDVRTVGLDTPLKEVALALSQLGVSGVPVVEAGKVVGVVSEADILVKERGSNPGLPGLVGLLFDETADIGRKLHARTAREAMSSPAVTIGPNRPVSEAAGVMIDRLVNRLPVVDEEGALIGIVTRADLVRAFARPDEEIADEIREDVVLHTLWMEPEAVNVRVEAGEVVLSGHVESETDADLVTQMTRKVPGVVSVVSRVTWDPDEKRSRRRDRSVALR